MCLATGVAVFASVPPAAGLGMGSGAMATFRQLGQALGVAVLGVVFADVIRGDLSGKVDDPASAESALTSGRRTTLGVLHDAGAHGLTAVYLASAALALLTALGTAAFMRKRTEGPPTPRPRSRPKRTDAPPTPCAGVSSPVACPRVSRRSARAERLFVPVTWSLFSRSPDLLCGPRLIWSAMSSRPQKPSAFRT
ncbi:hypothetical protein GCM10020000_80060 [Streptomyces olivoverticillatus]